MRIIHFLESYANIGGAEAYAHQVISWCERQGHTNVIIYATAHPSERQYPVESGFHVPQPTYPQSAKSAIRKIKKIVADERTDVAFIHHVYHPDIIKSITDQLPSVAYVQGPYLFCPGFRQYLPRSERLCPHTAGLACLWNAYVQGCMYGRSPVTHWHHLQRTRAFLATYPHMHTIVVGSRFMRDMLVRNGLPSKKIIISPTFLLEDDNVPPFIPGSASAPPVILYTGRIVPEKGLHHLITALSKVSCPWRLVIAGDGPDKCRCRKLAQRYGIAGRVEFLGWLAIDEIRHLVETCDFVAVPSLWPEPFGRVGPEAFARGKPVVAYASGGITDWLHNGVNGLLVPTGNVAMLRQALITLLSDVSMRIRLGRQAYEGLVKDYHIDKHMPIIIAILNGAIREWKNGR